jgi:hypothetical protein
MKFEVGAAAASTQIDAFKGAIRRGLLERDRRNGMVSFMLRKTCASDLSGITTDGCRLRPQSPAVNSAVLRDILPHPKNLGPS